MKGLDSKNYYELLGVARQATTDQIKEAYREIARVYHPDSNFYSEIVPEKPQGGAMTLFQQITAAYNVLIHVEKRKLYDQSLPNSLRDWENEEEDVTATLVRPVRASGSNAANSASYGVFGSIPKEAEEEAAPSPRDPRASLAERLRWVFGLKR